MLLSLAACGGSAQSEPNEAPADPASVEVELTKPITLKDVAQQYHVSCEHLSRVFKKNLGMTFKEYLYSIRITHTCKMLQNTNKRILEIALEAGFPDLRSFGRQFDRVYHMTPKEYRQRYQKR